MTIMKISHFKFATAGVLAFSALTGLLAPVSASAALVDGEATFTINNDALKASNLFGLYLEKHWGPSDNNLAIDKFTVGGTDIAATGSSTTLFTVNTNTTNVDCPTCGTYGRRLQATTMDSSDTSIGQIGLSGAWRLDSMAGKLTPYDFNLTKTGGVWNVRTYDTSFGTQNFLTLTNVSESLNTKGQLQLSGDLKWATNTGDWGQRFLANGNNIVGSFNLTPAAVPVPAAVWMFGTGLLGLLGVSRRKSVMTA